MSESAEEIRRARGSFRAEGLPEGSASGETEAVVDDEGLSAGGARVKWLDADGLLDADRVLTLSLWPSGTLRLSMLGRRHETFARALGEARDAARVRGLLAHGLGTPQAFDGSCLLGGAAVPARLLVFATHLTAVPEGRDPFQVPLGALREVRFEREEYRVVLETGEGAHAFGHLARRTEAFVREVERARDEQGRRLAQAAGSPAFADGLGVPAASLPDFDRLLSAFTAPERSDFAGEVLSRAGRAGARLGLVELLDPDEESLAARVPLPKDVAAFLLAAVGDRVVLEVLSGPSAATYVFRGDAAAVNRDLQSIHFRRRALALTQTEASGEAGRPYRLALRRLEPLRRLRSALVARVVHAAGWKEGLARALA